jgi:hypothetical protein
MYWEVDIEILGIIIIIIIIQKNLFFKYFLGLHYSEYFTYSRENLKAFWPLSKLFFEFEFEMDFYE